MTWQQELNISHVVFFAYFIFKKNKLQLEKKKKNVVDTNTIFIQRK